MNIARAAEAVLRADALVVTAGAGMGVDSGLPDFRGPEGFWRAYPPFAALGLSFEDVANPRMFERDPELAWGFYGHRLNLYRQVQPHAGYEALLRIAGAKPAGYFVFTSNVDGHFVKAGFASERVVECHGAIEVLQCTRPCRGRLWPATDLRIDVDAECRASSSLPRCPDCGAIARPNILMFGDARWQDARTAAQELRYDEWLRLVSKKRLVIVECGAGLSIPTVQMHSEDLVQRKGATLIRINPSDTDIPDGQISLPLPARPALERLREALRQLTLTTTGPYAGAHGGEET